MDSRPLLELHAADKRTYFGDSVAADETALKRSARPADSEREYATYTKLKSEAEQAETR